jgi:hypothetical protein
LPLENGAPVSKLGKVHWCKFDKLLWTEYHRLAVPDKYRRVSPVCLKRVGMLNLITKTQWSS